jgi:hypothetical protein
MHWSPLAMHCPMTEHWNEARQSSFVVVQRPSASEHTAGLRQSPLGPHLLRGSAGGDVIMDIASRMPTTTLMDASRQVACSSLASGLRGLGSLG